MTSAEFSDLFARYWNRFILISASYVRDRKAAEDIVSDVFTKFWDDRNRITLQGPPEAYILRMVRNRSLNYLRDNLSHERIQNSIKDEQLCALQVEADSLSENTADWLFSPEIGPVFQTFINNLPPLRRKIFNYAKFEGMTYAEIAVRLGVTPRKVKREISAVLNCLRNVLADYV